MLSRLGLRVRVFLFFAALALAGAAVFVAGLALGARHVGLPEAMPGFVTAGAVGVVGLVTVTALVWLLFDEHVARPIQRLSAAMRARAHAGAGQVEAGAARWLGDLGPAACAVSEALEHAAGGTEQTVAKQTARLEGEKARLQAILERIPVGVILFAADGRIVLYDGNAAAILGAEDPLCLDRPLAHWLDAGQLDAARRALANAPQNRHVFRIADAQGALVYEGTLRALDEEAGYMLTLETQGQEALERPLVFDFALIGREPAGELAQTPLDRLAYVVFDTETTGLDPVRDAVVQLAAVRIVNGRIVSGERLDTLVDPGRPIPPTASRIHGISDEDICGAPDIASVCRRFERFSREAVLVAHNAPFDIGILRHSGAALDRPVLDTVLLSAVLFGAEAEHTLDAIAARLDVTIPPKARHTALGDAQATAEVLRLMLPMLAARGVVTLGDAIAAMRRHGALLPDLNR